MRTLITNLERKLAIFAEQATGPDDTQVARSWRQICAIEAKCVIPFLPPVHTLGTHVDAQ